MDCFSSAPGISQARVWSGFPFPSPGYLPDLGVEPGSPALQVDCSVSESLGKGLAFRNSIKDFPLC